MNNKNNEWWENVFNNKYLYIYSNIITPNRTKAEINFLLKNLRLKKGAKILDLACGYGRHSIELAKKGFNVTGIDYSENFLKIAREEARKNKVKAIFLRKDMRKLNFINKFDASINIFTSFGYFKKDTDNEKVIENVSRALRKGAQFIIDLNNSVRSIQMILENGRKNKKTGRLERRQKDILPDGVSVTTINEVDFKTMRWYMTRTWGKRGKLKSFKTDIRLYFLPEIRKMLEENKMKIVKVFGDFDGSGFDYDSRRLIVLAVKK